jgi:hypothetical protein
VGFGDRLGREHFDALGQEHRRFTLHHHLVLQVFHTFDHFGQANFQAGQGFARERRTGFGRIALPGHGIANVQAGCLQQVLGFLGPIAGQCVLTQHPLELIELFLDVLQLVNVKLLIELLCCF